MSTKTRRFSPPETLAQAAEWERTKGRYVSGGLCEKCAAQAAWGHQKGAGGWAAIQPPCARCAAVVDLLPIETPNPLWKKVLRQQSPPVGAAPRSTERSGV